MQKHKQDKTLTFEHGLLKRKHILLPYFQRDPVPLIIMNKKRNKRKHIHLYYFHD